MDLKILFIFLIYYGVLSLSFLLGGSVFTEASEFNNTIELNDSELSGPEIEQGGFFSVGVSFVRFVAFVGFGIGLPSDTPTWFATMYIIWSSIVTILMVGFVMSSIWDG